MFSREAISSFSKKFTSRASQSLQEIRVDVRGPIKPCLFGKHLYFLFFIDDYSRKTWVYFLKEKYNVFNCFKKFKALVEKKISYFIKSLRTNFKRRTKVCMSLFVIILIR